MTEGNLLSVFSSAKTLMSDVSAKTYYCVGPMWARDTPFSSLSFHFLIFCSFLLFLFSFLIRLSISSPFSTRVIPLHFKAEGPRRQPNLALVCCVYFMLSVLFNLKSRSSLLAMAQPDGPGKRAVKRLCVCMCVCVLFN